MQTAEKVSVSQTRGDKVFGVINAIFIVFITIITLYPLIYVCSASISSPASVTSGRMWLWPTDITLEGYKRILKNSEIWMGYANTIFYTVVNVAISLAVTLPAAYALTVKSLPGRKFIVFVFSVTMFFSGGMIPLYVVCRNLGLVNTLWAVILPSATSMWYIILTRTFFQSTIPHELEEASEIDGCSVFATFLRIVIPLSAPIIAVMALYFGVGRWNSYFGEMIFLRDRSKFPLQLFLREILLININNANNAAGNDAADVLYLDTLVKYAMIIISTVPILCIYPFVQKYFMKGVMMGSIKE